MRSAATGTSTNLMGCTAAVLGQFRGAGVGLEPVQHSKVAHIHINLTWSSACAWTVGSCTAAPVVD